jgi:membrane-associated phospholipid phosphatase
MKPRIEEILTLILFLISATLDLYFGISFLKNGSEYLYFFFAMLIPAFFGSGTVIYFINRFFCPPNQRYTNPLERKNLLAIGRTILFLLIGYYGYSHLKVLIPLINKANYDDLLFNIDKIIFFGNSPTLEMLKIRSAAFTKLMYLGYTSFYAAFPVSFAAAFLSKYKEEVRRLIFGILAIYFIGMIFYYLVPALGPLFYTPDLFSHIPNIWKDILWEGHLAIQNNTATFAPTPFLGVAAFPSLHAAHMIFLFLVARHYHKWLFYIYIPWTAILCMATIFMGWHYVIDLIAGAIVAIFSFKITNEVIKTVQ